MEDKELRQEFARLFGWYDFEKEYGYAQQKKTLKEPTWAEIYCEIGKLLNCRGQKNFSERLENLEQSVTGLYDTLASKSHPLS